MIQMLRVFEARKLGHVYFFNKWSLKECIVDIKLMHLLIVAKDYCEDDLDCLWANN